MTTAKATQPAVKPISDTELQLLAAATTGVVGLLGHSNPDRVATAAVKIARAVLKEWNEK